MNPTSTSTTSDPRPPGSEPPREAPEDTIRAALGQLPEIKAYAQHFLSAKVDLVKLSVRKTLVYAVLGILALAVGATVVITAAALLIIGAAQGIAALLGGRAWAGNLIVSALVLGLLALGAWLGMRWFFNRSRDRTAERYEKMLQRERVQLDGHDARERSAEYVASHE